MFEFYVTSVCVVRKLREKDTVVKAGDFNGHVGSSPENYEEHHGGYDYGARNK